MEKVGSGGGGEDVPRGLSLCLVCVFDTQDSGGIFLAAAEGTGPRPSWSFRSSPLVVSAAQARAPQGLGWEAAGWGYKYRTAGPPV